LTHVPMDRQVLRGWLKAGFLEKHAWFATTDGTPQGGIASPALANRTLDGLQRLLAEHFAKTSKQQRMNKVHLVRYADDCAPRRCERTTSGVSLNAMLRER
jgi:RNA-directed DNA polymerase